MWTRNLVEKVWIHQRVPSEDKALSGSKKDLFEAVESMNSSLSAFYSDKGAKSVTIKNADFEKLVYSDMAPKLSFRSYRIFGRPVTTTVDVNKVHAGNVMKPSSGAKSSGSGGGSQEGSGGGRQQANKSVIQYTLEYYKSGDKRDGLTKLRTVYLFSEAIGTNPYLKALNKFVNYKSGINLNSDKKNQDLIDFKV
ncbi:hypothetical protein AYI70_g5878 [Smittium culicis]|uniref:Uncharacterized protein n=2 Tax=Smittium culicis TaxID=133412 RepID=A0A1R1XSJ7_9FUNG|nr:hypothetical protein AYI70_g5878 [Smittium culicis]